MDNTKGEYDNPKDSNQAEDCRNLKLFVIFISSDKKQKENLERPTQKPLLNVVLCLFPPQMGNSFFTFQ